MLVVLTFTSLLTVVLVLALVHSTKTVDIVASNEGRQAASNLADLAWHSLVRNLQAEIRAGSQSTERQGEPADEVSVESDAGELKFRFYYPATAANAVPCPTRPGPPANLLKWSSRNSVFFGEWSGAVFPYKDRFPPAKQAAPVSTLDPSLNGVKISPRRWNLPLLLPKKEKGQTDVFPDLKEVPDWVLVSASGALPRSLDNLETDPVVGRYAYMIYNEGGLLDVNTAGVPSTVASSTDPVRALKGGVRLADLTPIMEAAGFKGGEPQDFSDSLTQWRDASRGADPSAYREDLRAHPVSSAGRAVPAHWCGYPDCNRCKIFVPGSAVNPKPKRVFNGREALIQRVLSQGTGSLAARQNLLQYLGTFNRCLEQPSLSLSRPTGLGNTPDRIKSVEEGGNNEFDWDGRQPSSARQLNPPFLHVRVKHGFHRADGTWAVPGEPLVKRRFSLARLSRLDVLEVDELKNFFGFERSAKGGWDYVNMVSQGNGRGRILTLAEVADLQEAREPNFIELLKAAIYAGALAGGLPENVAAREEWERSLDCAVIQIAANLMDQYDADSYPTRIGMEVNSEIKDFWGVEALPYLHGVQSHLTVIKDSVPVLSTEPPFARVGISSPISAGTVLFWQTVALWNPHTNSTLEDVKRGERVPDVILPQEFKVVVSSDLKFRIQPRQEAPMEDTAPPRVAVPATDSSAARTFDYTGSLSGGTLNLSFKWPHASWPTRTQDLYLFENPVWLPESGDKRLALQPEESPENLVSTSGLPAPGLGVALLPRIFKAQVAGSFSSPAPRAYAVLASVYTVSPEPTLTYRLQYRHPVLGHWVDYDEKHCKVPSELRIDAVNWSDLRVSDKHSASLFPDPRTERWGSVSVPRGTEFQFDYTNLPSPLMAPDADGIYRSPYPPSSGVGEGLTRPCVLNRPFRSVGEMAYAFAGVPWRHLDFGNPESGFAGLLDVFCAAEIDDLFPFNSYSASGLFEDLDPLKSGRVDLNTRQVPVLKALLSGAAAFGDVAPSGPIPSSKLLSDDMVQRMADKLVLRTGDPVATRGALAAPLRNVSELVGFWSPRSASSGSNLGSELYDGFSKDMQELTSGTPGGAQIRESAIRALADAGQTRVWNVLIDVIVQSGRYPRGLKPLLQQFMVTGEARLWVHVALDRLTGEVLDVQVEHPSE
jgi:hypothetical protein